MKHNFFSILIILALVGLSSCKGETPVNPSDEPTALSELNSETTFVEEHTETAINFTEESRKNMDADHALWRKNKDAFIKKVEDELTAKGWRVIEESIFSEARYVFMYHIIGCVDNRYNNPMTVNVGVVFSEGVPEGKQDYVTYTSESGRWYGCTEILSANDKRLYEYMHNSDIPQVQ